MTFETWYKQKYPDDLMDEGLSEAFREVAQAAWEAGRAASRRPIAIIQRSGNSWNVFEQRYNDDRTERNDRLIRGGFVTSVDATSWARSNGYEVEV